MLTYEASRTFEAQTFEIETPVAPTTGTRLKNPPLIVPVLRAGLGMADAALALLPESSMGFVGLARDEHTFEPRPYMESLPQDLTGIPVLVLDPMVATGGSLEHCCRLLVDRGCTDITVLCALTTPEAIARLEATGMPMRVVTASIDDGLTATMFITLASAMRETANSVECPDSEASSHTLKMWLLAPRSWFQRGSGRRRWRRPGSAQTRRCRRGRGLSRHGAVRHRARLA
jgi:uracil phosphoribosyltransferase